MTTGTRPGRRAHELDHPAPTGLSLVQGDRVAYWLGAGLAVASAVAAAATLLVPGLLTGPPVMNGSARGTALVILVVALPVLAVSLRAAAHGSARAVIVWLGSVGYLLYNAVMFAFATPFNRLFLLYLAMLALALWTAGALVSRTDLGALARRCSPELPVRWLAAYALVVAGLNAVAWLAGIVPALASRRPSELLDGTGLTTNPVYVQDLAVWLPLVTVAAVWLLQRRPQGVLVVGAGLVMWVIEALGIAVDQWFGSVADPSSPVASAAAVPAFLVVTALGLVPAVVLLRHIDR